MMDDEQQKIKDHFAKHLKAEKYVKCMSKVWDEIPELFRFMLVSIMDVFRSQKYSGSKLLEIGSGATVHNVASASAYFPNITMSDFVADNVENLRLWVEGKSNLRQLLEIPAGLEGYGNDLETGIKLLENRLRKSIKRVTRTDVLTDQVLLENSSDPYTSPPFDMIISCLTMEVAPKDYNEYCESLKRVNKFLKKGGGLLMCGFLQGSHWNIEDVTFHHIKLGERELINALEKAGFGNINLKTMEGKEGKEVKEGKFTYAELFCVDAEKIW